MYGPATYRGMGDAQGTQQAISIAGSGATAASSAVLGSIAASGGTVLGLSAAAVIPIAGAVIAGITLAVIQLTKGCGQTCIVASNYANQVEQQMRANINAYFALPAPRTVSQQAIALANFNTLWQALQNACGNGQLADAGVRCVTDRQAGACHWRQPAASVPPWGTPAAGECWNWFSGYRDPIANDPAVPDTATSEITAAFNSVTGATGIPASYLLIGALLLAGAVVIS